MSIRTWLRPRVMPHPGTHQDTPLLQPRLALPAAPVRAPAPVRPAPPAPRWHWPCPAIDRLQYHIQVMRTIPDENVLAAYFEQHYGYALREAPERTAEEKAEYVRAAAVFNEAPAAEVEAGLAKVMTP